MLNVAFSSCCLLGCVLCLSLDAFFCFVCVVVCWLLVLLCVAFDKGRLMRVVCCLSIGSYSLAVVCCMLVVGCRVSSVVCRFVACWLLLFVCRS